jgi:hypothetical protein
MRKTTTQIILLSITGTIAGSLLSCGSSKIEECGSMIKVIKDYKVAADEIEAGDDSGKVEKTIQAFTVASGKVDKVSKDMKALEIKDEKLVSLQTRFGKLYQDTSKGLSDAASKLKAKDEPGAKAILTKMAEGDKQEAVIIEEIRAYCSKK